MAEDEQNEEEDHVKWWNKKSPFDIPGFNMEIEKIEKLMKELMNRGMEDLEHKPLVFGISMKSGPDGIPRVSEFGNVKDYFVNRDHEREWTPLTDVQETEDDVLVTVDMPGVEKKDIDLKVVDRELIIDVDSARKYHTQVRLPTDVEIDDADATYVNGVLEVKLKKKKSSDEVSRINVK